MLFPIEDSCISKYNAKVNFGKSDSLLIGSSSSGNDYYKTLLKFDVSSIFSKVSISRVLLRLYVYKKEKTGQQEVTAYKLLQNFEEMEVNWNNQPSHEELGSSSIMSDGNLNGYFDIDVTSIVNQWINDKTEVVHGIEVIASESASSFIWFRSREYTQEYMWPRLIVEYDDSKLVTDSKQDGDVSIESCNLYQLGNNFSAAYKVKKDGDKKTLAVLEISDDGLVWFSEKAVEVVNGEYKVIATSSSRKYDRISLVIIKNPEIYLPTGTSIMAERNVINENSAALNYTSNDINIPVDESGRILVNKTGITVISINAGSEINSPNISFNVVGQIRDNEELSNALDDVSITNINIPAGNFSISNHLVDISRSITISGMVDDHGNILTNLILSELSMYILSLKNIQVELKNINIIALKPNSSGIRFQGQFLFDSSISLKNVHMMDFNTALNFSNLSNIDISECEFINNNEALVFSNSINSKVLKTKFKDNSKTSITIEGNCSNLDINAEFENSPNNDFIGISIIDNYSSFENINITGSSFTGFTWRKRVTYTNIPDLPFNHVIYGVSTENDLRDVLTNWREIGTVNILQSILDIATPIEIKSPVILSGVSREIKISAASTIGNLSFVPYSAVIAADSNNVTIQNLIVDGNNFAQNGIYVHGDNCSIYNNIIRNIVRPEGKAACGDGIIAYKEGTTASPSPISILNIASNIINTTARHGIFVETLNTETKQFFMSTNISITNNRVNDVWNDPLTPIETQEPNGIFSAAIELQGLQKSTTEFKDNLIFDVKNNLKRSYIYFSDTDETQINGVLKSHNANLSSIQIATYLVDLNKALITDINPNGAALEVGTQTTTGISITQGEPNSIVVLEVVRNGVTTVIDKALWDSYDFNINDVISVKCTSQDKVVTNVYKIAIIQKTLQPINVADEQQLRAALLDDSIGHISLLNDITLTSALSINKYIILDSNGTNKFTLTTPNLGNDITFGNGADESVLRSLIIDGELVIDIGEHGSMTIENVDISGGIKILSGSINSINLNGVKTDTVQISCNARVAVNPCPASAAQPPIPSDIGSINMDAQEKPTAPPPTLQVANSKVKNVNVRTPRAVVAVNPEAKVERIAVEAPKANIQVAAKEKVKTVQVNAQDTTLTLSDEASVETLNLNANNLNISGKNIDNMNIESGVTDINTIHVEGYEQTNTDTAKAGNSSAVIFALTQNNIKNIILEGIFEDIAISGKSITNISGAVDNREVSVDDIKVLKYSVLVYSIAKINLLPGVYDEALEINRPVTLQGTSNAVLKSKTEKSATAINILSNDVAVTELQIDNWDVGVNCNEKSYGISIIGCEFTSNNQAIVLHDVRNARIIENKLKYNIQACVVTIGKCSNIIINSQFEHSLVNGTKGISIIGENNSIPRRINITGSEFIDFAPNKRIVYTDIPNLPDNHVIYDVSTESSLRTILGEWPEVGIINILSDIENISNPIEILRPVVLGHNPLVELVQEKKQIIAGSNISKLSFVNYSAVIGIKSNDVAIVNLTIDGKECAENGIYVQGDNCGIYGNIIKNIVRPTSEAACGSGITVYKSGNTTSQASINGLNIMNNNISNMARQGIFVEAFNTEIKEFFMSNNIHVIDNTVDNVWNNPLTPIETSEPNGMFSAAIELQGLQKSTTALENNVISNVKNNLKEIYVYYSDTNETLIDGVLASHKADLNSIKIVSHDIDLSKALVTVSNPNGVNLVKCDSETLTGISIEKGETNETIIVKVNGTPLDAEQWTTNAFNINDVILVESKSQDTLVTKVYKVTIKLNQAFVSDEVGLKNALADNCVKQVTLEKGITLTNSIDINRNIILDSSGTNKYALTLPVNTAVNLKSGCSGIQVNNLDIENGQLNVNIRDKESVSLNNVTAAINDSNKIDVSISGATGDSVFNIKGMNTNNVSIISSGKVILDKYSYSGIDTKSTIKKINMDASAVTAILEVSNSQITDLDLGAVFSEVTLEQETVITNLNINGTNTNLTVDSGVVDNLVITGVIPGTTTGKATAGQFGTVQINKGKTTLEFDDSCIITKLNLNCNDIIITCPDTWITSGKFIVQSGVTDKSTVIINTKPITDYGL
ncbi:DNRLRE domain-containing protein [Clostridium muellerianum]|uniref:DNRLRE domain-containing protein n=1 Tax=Clostridium muellerianum TaxID=2716538 RepID=UPI00315AD9AC